MFSIKELDWPKMDHATFDYNMAIMPSAWLEEQAAFPEGERRERPQLAYLRLNGADQTVEAIEKFDLGIMDVVFESCIGWVQADWTIIWCPNEDAGVVMSEKEKEVLTKEALAYIQADEELKGYCNDAIRILQEKPWLKVVGMPAGDAAARLKEMGW